MVEIVRFWKGLSKSNQPGKGVPGANLSFSRLKKAIDDPLIPVKLQEIASKLNSFLLVFQTDKPMIPFFVEVLENLLRTLLAKFIKKDVLQTACFTLKLIKIDKSDTKVQKSAGDLDLGFSIKHDFKQLALQKRATDQAVFMLKEEVISFLTKLCNHMIEKSPLTSLFARCLHCLSPAYMLEQPEICEKFFEKILEKLVSYKSILAKDTDAAKLEYSNFLKKIVKANKSDFVKFTKSSDQVHLFFGKYINISEYEHMWCVFKLLLLETTIDSKRKNADILAQKALMRITFAEMKSQLRQSNVLKRAPNEKQEELDKQFEKKKVLL